jgi:hypothetical protein
VGDAALLAAAFLLGLILREFLPSYLREKGKNIATREDLGNLTQIVEDIKTENQLLLEKVKPLTAEETLRRQSAFNSRVAAFNQTLEVVYRKFAAEEMNVHDADPRQLSPASTERPTEVEVNGTYGHLALVAANRAVLDKYLEIQATKSTPAHIGQLVALMRQDLGFGEPIVAGDEYAYIFDRGRTRRER